jgi:hypothetical protein
MSSESESTTLQVTVFNLNGSDNCVQHTESLGLWTLSILRISNY